MHTTSDKALDCLARRLISTHQRFLATFTTQRPQQQQSVRRCHLSNIVKPKSCLRAEVSCPSCPSSPDPAVAPRPFPSKTLPSGIITSWYTLSIFSARKLNYYQVSGAVLMSLQFSEDPRSKREKQEIFKQSLDDQRRMQQEASLASSKPDPDHGQFVPGLDGVAAGMNRIPGLEHHQQGGGGAAPRFEGSSSPQEKQPYMSAVSDMRRRGCLPMHTLRVRM